MRYNIFVMNEKNGNFATIYRTVIVGGGAAGLFFAAKYGDNRTLILERGDRAGRKLSATGGAGTFSDGKLNTGTHVKENDEVLREFIRFGAPEEIAYLNKPHIGSDKLKIVVKNMREYLLANGARVLFNARLTNLKIENGKIAQAEIAYRENDSSRTETIDVSALVLAVGHSARDTFELLHKKGVELTKKDFAVGVRIEHLQSAVGFSQYGEKYKLLPPADYKCVFHGERAAFTFCMCPGGYVMAAASEEGAW